jgi:hypothetical protein
VDSNDPLDWIDDAEYVDGEGEYRPAFVVDTDEKAAWALRKYDAALDRMQQAIDLAEAEQERIRIWVEARKQTLGRDVDFFGGLLQRYALDQREQEGRKKVDLPGGVIQTRSTAERLVITDREDFVEWARKYRPDLLKTTYSPSLADINNAVLMDDGVCVAHETGDIVPGVGIEPAKVTATIKTAKEL